MLPLCPIYESLVWVMDLKSSLSDGFKIQLVRRGVWFKFSSFNSSSFSFGCKFMIMLIQILEAQCGIEVPWGSAPQGPGLGTWHAQCHPLWESGQIGAAGGWLVLRVARTVLDSQRPLVPLPVSTSELPESPCWLRQALPPLSSSLLQVSSARTTLSAWSWPVTESWPTLHITSLQYRYNCPWHNLGIGELTPILTPMQ